MQMTAYRSPAVVQHNTESADILLDNFSNEEYTIA